MPVVDERHYNCWVMVSRSDEIKGVWIAHCLDVDIVTQGTSLADAVKMAIEAFSMAVVDDLNRGVEPNRPKAPQEYWDKLTRLFKVGKQVECSPDQLDENHVVELASLIFFHFEKTQAIEPTTPLRFLKYDETAAAAC